MNTDTLTAPVAAPHRTGRRILAVVAFWSAGPAWYPLTLVALTMPCAWLGGRLRQRA